MVSVKAGKKTLFSNALRLKATNVFKNMGCDIVFNHADYRMMSRRELYAFHL
jgi:hypothetical protein